MIDYSRENVVKISKETGFIKDNVEKVLRLADLLETLFSTGWENKLALKGGTAINMFYRNMSRLSVDIDLDYLGQAKEEMIEDKVRLKEYMSTLIYNKGYEFSETIRQHYALDSYILNYTNNAGNKDIIKVEVNFLDRTHILPICESKVNILGIESAVPIKILDKHELYGSKLAALIDRSKPRDVYDVYGLVKDRENYNSTLLRKSLVFYNCVGGYADILQFDEKKLDMITKNDYRKMLQPMLSKQERFNSSEAINSIKNYLKELMVFNKDEKLFIEKFKEKEFKPELLFDEGNSAVRVGWHPMAFWKCEKTDIESKKVQEELLRRAIIMENRGIESLKSLSDIGIVCDLKHSLVCGDFFVRIYNGEKVFVVQEKNDIALINLINLKTNDKESILRVYKSSGQYNDKKDDGYYLGLIDNQGDIGIERTSQFGNQKEQRAIEQEEYEKTYKRWLKNQNSK